jgi:succinoglycan biosynthesis protein ExoA
VSVVVPVLNEEEHLADCLQAVAIQTYPRIVEVLVVDGGSTDGTRTVAVRFPRVRILENPERLQASGLNVALAAAHGEVIVRVDGHALIEPQYVERCVEALQASGATMVGGQMVPVRRGGRVQRAVAIAMASRLGAGPARFHIGGPAGWVDTVYLGSYRTELARRVGGYDPALVPNEDAEFAHRLGRLGGVWFDPRIRAQYFPRRDLAGLARQFFRYGRARSATIRRHPDSLSLRQLAAPLLIVGLMSPWRRWVASLYGTVLTTRAVVEVRRDPGAAAALPAVLPAMHLAWGLGFLAGLASPAFPCRQRDALTIRSKPARFRGQRLPTIGGRSRSGR